jgi:hypothetical protein
MPHLYHRKTEMVKMPKEPPDRGTDHSSGSSDTPKEPDRNPQEQGGSGGGTQDNDWADNSDMGRVNRNWPTTNEPMRK